MMNEQDFAVKLEAHSHEIGSLKHRMEQVETDQRALNSLATSVAVMVEKQDAIAEKVEGIDAKVSTLEQRPAKKWDGIVEKALAALVGAFVAWILSGGVG